MTPILDQVTRDYGLAEKCKISDPEKVERILHDLIHEGSTKLQVITDFDLTLSRFHKDGKMCHTLHGIIDHSPLMPAEYGETMKILHSSYYPIEINDKMSTEEKIPHVVAFYKECRKLLLKYQLTKPKINEMVKSGNAQMRDLAQNVLSFLNDHNIPCLIFSAGQGDILEELLHREKVFFPNLKIVSNYMCFNEDGLHVSFKEPMIHVLNKTDPTLNSTYFEEMSHRNNALVVGDAIGDAGMGNGMPNPGAVLKIGFLNDKVDDRLESFMKSFDVVLIDDQSFKFVDVVLKKIVCHP